MREIKFRAWDSVEERMYYPGDIKLSVDFFGDIYDDGEKPPKNVSYRTKIMQFTGLHDKNGKEIYEDDLWFCDGCQYLVQWTGAYASFNLVAIEQDNKHTGEILEMFHAFKGEVIGNIYTNPELLDNAKGN